MPLQSQDPNQPAPPSQSAANQLWASAQGQPLVGGQQMSPITGLLTNPPAKPPVPPPVSAPTSQWAPAALEAGLSPQDISFLQSQLQQLTAGEQPGASKVESGTGYATQKTDPSSGQTQGQTPDALTQGLGMFFSQYLAPLMKSMNTQNMGMTQQWGNAMNQALQNPLPPGFKQLLQNTTPGIQQLMGLQNTADAAQTLGAGPFQQLMGNLQQNTAGLQGLMDAFTKAATYQELGAGSPVQLGSLLSNVLGGPNTLAGGLAQLLGGSSNAITGLTPAQPAVSAALANQQAQAGSTPTTPSVTPQP